VMMMLFLKLHRQSSIGMHFLCVHNYVTSDF
jgi:hypothetical protein